MPSCFGHSLECLTRMPAPLSSVSQPAISAPARPASEPAALDFLQASAVNTPPLPIPKELWRIVDYLFQHGLDQENLFHQSGVQSVMDAMVAALDTGKELPWVPEEATDYVCSMGEVLIRFLDSLHESVIPASLHRLALDASQSGSAARNFLAYLPTVHFNVFTYLTAFLREVLAHAATNHLTSSALAAVFAVVLLRVPPVMKAKGDINTKKRVEFMQHFLL
eukprot:CAMPEP_0177683742 /NCGR_PEP_ID=MMETSP0447-20121125/32010_1 /TAXON_ID=0 /ORGANISM="Stygamoeba regulata, Strain BSH-02190019" /LENGTH=221 /DNA_ID=CAMNT_0019193443 /DNA_START=1 /DNA_END=666 /DNA_ORIENTATION=+